MIRNRKNRKTKREKRRREELIGIPFCVTQERRESNTHCNTSYELDNNYKSLSESLSFFCNLKIIEEDEIWLEEKIQFFFFFFWLRTVYDKGLYNKI